MHLPKWQGQASELKQLRLPSAYRDRTECKYLPVAKRSRYPLPQEASRGRMSKRRKASAFLPKTTSKS